MSEDQAHTSIEEERAFLELTVKMYEMWGKFLMEAARVIHTDSAVRGISAIAAQPQCPEFTDYLGPLSLAAKELLKVYNDKSLVDSFRSMTNIERAAFLTLRSYRVGDQSGQDEAKSTDDDDKATEPTQTGKQSRYGSLDPELENID
jgi:hypothetical protein